MRENDSATVRRTMRGTEVREKAAMERQCDTMMRGTDVREDDNARERQCETTLQENDNVTLRREERNCKKMTMRENDEQCEEQKCERS
jgi:hypothetical protein